MRVRIKFDGIRVDTPIERICSQTSELSLGDPMVKDAIDHVVWYEKRGCMVLSYGDGESDRIVATKRIAAKLAQDVGLVLVPTAADTVLWVRNPGAWRALAPLAG